MSNEREPLPNRPIMLVDKETTDEYKKIVSSTSKLISTYDRKNVDIESIKENTFIYKLVEIKNCIINTNKCDRYKNEKKKVSKLIELLWEMHEKTQNIIKEYEILFIKNPYTSDKIICDSKILEYIRDYDFKQNSLYSKHSINKYLKTLIKELEDLKTNTEKKRDYYIGKNNTFYYYTIGYFSWLYNWFNSYKTIYNHYENYISIYITRLINDITIVINNNIFVLNVLYNIRNDISNCIIEIINLDCNNLEIETEISFLRTKIESNITTISSKLKD